MRKVSVIVPVYNTKSYLDRCVQSVLNQTHQNFELILIDDGSYDGSGELCDFYANKNNKVKVYHNSNKGPAVSRATGIKMASSELIMFVDSDDWLDKEILETLLKHMESSRAAMVSSIFVDMDDTGKKHHYNTFDVEYIDCMNVEDCMLHIHKTRYLWGSPCCKLFEKKLFDDVDFCGNVTIGEDYAMVVQVAERATKVRILNQELYYRYVRKGSISHSGYTERHKEAFDNYMHMRNYLILKYPKLQSDIIGFHTEFEMAVITAMCRNNQYDKEVIKKLKTDLKQNMKNTLLSKQIPAYMKGSAVLIAYVHPIFIFLFRILYLLTGR